MSDAFTKLFRVIESLCETIEHLDDVHVWDGEPHNPDCHYCDVVRQTRLTVEMIKEKN